MNIERVNKQDYLKFLAIICMIIDHIGLYFLPDCWSLRAIGRVAFPIFAFYAGYNFKNKLNYKILAHGIILYLLSLILTKQFLVPNILISIFVGQLYLVLRSKYQILQENLFWQYMVLITLWPLTKSYFEYGSIALLIMLVGSLYKEKILSNLQMANQVCVIIIVHSLIIFGQFFDEVDFWMWVISMGLLWVALSIREVQYSKYQINFINYISRNSLYIYSCHLAGFMMITTLSH